MKANELTQEKFPAIFWDRDNPILRTCRDFLEWRIDRQDFEAFVIETNTWLKEEYEKLDQFYRSWGMGRSGIMDGAPQYAEFFRLEVIQILDGKKPKWE